MVRLVCLLRVDQPEEKGKEPSPKPPSPQAHSDHSKVAGGVAPLRLCLTSSEEGLGCLLLCLLAGRSRPRQTQSLKGLTVPRTESECLRSTSTEPEPQPQPQPEPDTSRLDQPNSLSVNPSNTDCAVQYSRYITIPDNASSLAHRCCFTLQPPVYSPPPSSRCCLNHRLIPVLLPRPPSL